jgi:hypothetical protein
LKLLYHLSYDDDVKTQFAECVGLVRAVLIKNNRSTTASKF